MRRLVVLSSAALLAALPGCPNHDLPGVDAGQPDLANAIADLAPPPDLGSATDMACMTTFAPKVDHAAGHAPSSIVIADLDGDGRPDMVVTNHGVKADGSDGGVSVFLNPAGGGLTGPVFYRTTPQPAQMAVADLNGDGKADIVVAGLSLSVLLNQGAGTFPSHTEYDAPQHPGGAVLGYVAIGDLDGDGKPDLAVTDQSIGTVNVFINQGAGIFGSPVAHPAGRVAYGIAIGDVNGDRKADLVVGNQMDDTVSVLLNQGGGAFAPKVDYPTDPVPLSVVLGDLNGDGQLDLVVASAGTNTRGTSVSVFLNMGAGVFAPRQDYTCGAGVAAAAIGDLNGDGRPDLVVANTIDRTVSVLFNQGVGTFGPKHDYPTASIPNEVAIGDLDVDGRPDVAAACDRDGVVSVLLNVCQ